MRSRRPAVLATVFVFAALPLLASAASAAPGTARSDAARAEREATLAYWTPARMRSAIPRDYVFDPVRGFQPAAKPPGTPGGGGGGGGGGGDTVKGASWPNGKGEIYGAIGKVFFTLSGTNYVCSGTTTEDGIGDRAIVLTAGHCAYDESVYDSDSGFASKWMFVPKYDATPTINCFSTPASCWTASELVVHRGWATAGGFTSTATTYDWAFAVIGSGGGPTAAQLSGTVDAFPIDAGATYPKSTQMYAFGYPAAGKYNGTDLTYCAGKIFYDPYNSENTYGLSCDMTGGCSGGGWISGFDATTGNSDADSFLSSVNSYRYQSVNAIHGPKFNGNTANTWNAALGAAFDSSKRGVIVP